MKKIAFCFLIHDGINHEDIWTIFFRGVDTNKYNIYIHYKINTPLKHFEKYKLKHCIETKYEDYTIPLAVNLLFREAYEHDKENYKFILLSGACIPFKSFDHVYNKLSANPLGYFNICPVEQCFPTCNSLLTFLPKNIISKSHPWVIFNRKLVEQLCFDKDELIKIMYKDVFAPAEYYYYTYVKILGLENEIVVTHNLSNDATTYTHWSEHGLKNYSSISSEELAYLVNSQCLFGRKFTKECNLYL